MMNAIFPVLLEAALRALVAAALVWAALRLLRVRNVRAQKTAWTLMLAGALAMPLLMRWQWLPAADAIPAVRNVSRDFASAIFGLRAAILPADRIATADMAIPADRAPIPPAIAWSVPSNAAGQIAADESEPADRLAIQMSDLDTAPPVPSESAPLPYDSAPTGTAAAASPASGSLRIFDLAWMIYLAVAAALLLRLIAGAFAALRLWTTADPVLAPLAVDLAPAAGVRSSPRVGSPANIGRGIVLPADYGEWSDEKLRVVLAHEREHVRQGDFYLQLFAGFYAVLTWFSPLGWWLKRKLSELGEAMSDRAGLDEATSPSSYAQMLLEFAALPRPLRAGVAMARAGRLTSRIERVLNDATFRQAFIAGGRRAVLALVIAPLALLVSAALVHVQAASQAPAPSPQTSAETSAQTQASPQASQQTGVSSPPAQTVDEQDQQQPTPSPAAPPNPAAEPSAAPPAAQAPEPAPAPAVGADAGEGSGSGQGQGAGAGAGMQPVPPVPAAPGQVPVPPIHVQVPPVNVQVPPMPPMPNVNAEIRKAMRQQREAMRKSFYFSRDGRRYAFDGGEPWALVPAQGEPIVNTGPLHSADRAEIDKARATAHAPFFWFKHEGKSYVVEDPSLVAQIETLEKPIEDLRSQMRALGKQQRALGEQMRQQMRAQRQQPIPKPDLSKQMAELNAAVESLKASQGDTVTRDQLRNLQKQVAQLQGQISRAEFGFDRQNGQWGAEMGAFGKQMGQLGGEQGRLAGEMARTSMDSRAKIDGIIKQSLSDGKAKPVN